MEKKAKTNRERNLIIGVSDVRMLFRLFDCTYKLGVNDAFRVNDYGLINEFITDLEQPHVFGRVIDGRLEDWLYWMLILKNEVSHNQLYKSAYKMFDRYTTAAGWINRNYLGVAYTIMKCFYIQGLKDWCEYGLADLDRFNEKSKTRLTDNGVVRKWSLSDMVNTAQMMCYTQLRTHQNCTEKRIAHKEKHFTRFIRVLSYACDSRFESIS